MASLDGPTPSAAAIVAIASAYLLVTRRDAPAPPPPEVPRWRLAARFEPLSAGNLRSAGRIASRWNAAGRLDG